MLHKIDLGNEAAVGYRWEGNYDEAAFKQSVAQFLPDLRSRPQLNVYFEVYEISEVEANAVWKELKFDMSHLQELLDRINKIALVTDTNWLRNLAEASYKLIPGIELKAFKFTEKEAAKLWVIE